MALLSRTLHLVFFSFSLAPTIQTLTVEQIPLISQDFSVQINKHIKYLK